MDIDIPNLPIGEAAAALLKAAPVVGAIIIFLVAGIVALAWAFLRLLKTKDDRIAEKDKELAAAKDKHIEDLKQALETVQELRETVIDIASARGRRT